MNLNNSTFNVKLTEHELVVAQSALRTCLTVFEQHERNHTLDSDGKRVYEDISDLHKKFGAVIQEYNIGGHNNA